MALTACGGKGSAGDEAAAAVVVDGPVEFPLAETVTLTGTTSYPAGSESEPNNRTIFKRLGRIHQRPHRVDCHPVRPVGATRSA